jgi:hypothetical protein
MTHPIEVWIVMNEFGQYVVADDEETVSERADEMFDEDETRRYVTLKFKLAPPNDDVISSQTFELTLE